ncbi:MAG: helix-turn-helix domain-containing protein [Deltaproteobacteria bacterium]|nr:helix-turn-helix domain-containing protein [Deltaproteobacteria bacterium]
MQKLLNTVQAAEILGLRPNTLEIWRHRHVGPKYKKLGRRVLYDPADLAEFAESCTILTRRPSGAGNSASDDGGEHGPE